VTLEREGRVLLRGWRLPFGGRGVADIDRLTAATGLSEEQALALALASEKVRAALNGGRPSKVIYVQDRLINLVP